MDRLVDLVKQETLVIPPIPGDEHTEEVLAEEANNNKGGLEAAFEAIKKKARRDEEAEPKESEESVVNSFLTSKLEKDNLKCWAKFEEQSVNSPIALALCRVARKYLTPPPTSTNSERLFSVAGQVMDENRARILPDSLEKILFLRENLVTCNFSLDW